MYNTLLRVILIILLAFTAIHAEDIHPNDIVKRMKKNFKTLETYKANFNITTTEGKKVKRSKGVAYYKKGGKLNLTFTSPYGDKIISNGSKMWVYIRSMNAVGEQKLKTKNKKTGIQTAISYEGMVSLFRRYHYRFDTIKQPRLVNNQSQYVLELKEKTTSGGFKSMKVFVGGSNYLINKIIAKTESGKTVIMQYSNIKKNINLADKLFVFKPKGKMRILKNPLTSE